MHIMHRRALSTRMQLSIGVAAVGIALVGGCTSTQSISRQQAIEIATVGMRAKLGESRFSELIHDAHLVAEQSKNGWTVWLDPNEKIGSVLGTDEPGMEAVTIRGGRSAVVVVSNSGQIVSIQLTR